MPDGSNLKGGVKARAKRTVRKHIRLRTPENAERICSLTEDGWSSTAIARELGCTDGAIFHWIREDQQNGGREVAQRYARATEIRWERMAEGLLELVQRDCRGVDGRPDNALVQQLRLDVDTRKWLLSKMHPRRFGDKIEISGDPDAPVVSRIELVAVHPRPQVEAPLIEGKKADDDG